VEVLVKPIAFSELVAIVCQSLDRRDRASA